MKWNQKVIRLTAMSLSLLLMLTACQVPEGVEVPSGVSIPSDLSDLTSEELEQLESYLEDTETSVDSEDAEDSAEAGDEGGQTDADAAGREDATDAQSITDEEADAEAENGDAKSAVTLPSGREWVKYILDVAEYKRAYKDLQAAFGDDWDAYVDHYLTTGLYEGRDQGKLFDPWAYAEAYPDVKEECGDDANKIIEHYVTFGIKENRPIGTTEGYEDFADKTSREAMVGEAIDRTPSGRLEALVKHAENALLYGRNIEGALYPQLLVDGIDPVTKEPAIWNKFTSDKYYVSNLYGQSLLLKMLEGLTWITGEEKYKDAAYTQIQMRFDDPELADVNGLPYAGDHVLFDVFAGKKYAVAHETKDDQLPVELYYRVDPEGFERFVTAYWNAHIFDPSCLVMNRHGEFNKPMQNGDFWSSEYTNPSPWIESSTAPFIVTANDMIDLAGYLSVQTGDPKYIAWGNRLLDKYIAITNKETGLTGSVYGMMYKTSTNARDRFLQNFAGADFVDATGVDYKTLTEDDYEICGETMILQKTTLNSTTGYGPQAYINLYRLTGDEKYYDFVKNNLLGFVRYVYDPVRHVYKTPMSTNGTDFNPGEDNGPILVAPRAGYYRQEGLSFAESETPADLSLWGLIETVNMLKDEDAAEKAELWEAARTWAVHAGLGDIGTAPGENVNVNLNTQSTSVAYTMTVISLYKYTGHQQYYDLAVKMGENIIKEYFNEETGLFTSNSKAPYVKFNSQQMYAVFCVEAMTRGLLDQINLDFAASGVETNHDGIGSEATESDVFYGRSKVRIKKLDLGTEAYSLVMDQVPNIEMNDIYGHESERAIRQMVALGIMDVDANGNFTPEASVTRGKFVQMVVELFGFTDTSVPADFRFSDVAGKSYYEAVVAAENAGIMDENMGATLFDGEKIVTREEMASIIVKALQVKKPEIPWHVANALYRIQDADSISAWAKDYVDIATNYRLMIDITEDIFNPKLDVNNAMVADTFQNICRYIELPQLQKISATISPYNADRQVITWETSDATVLEIDEQGRLYPLKSGSVIVTATADSEISKIEVIISEKEGWMIKEIYVDGELLENFNANTRAYEMNLYLGTTTAPAVTAVSYSGEPVDVKLPDELPGRVELNVHGYDVKYTIDMDNTLVNYAVNENFNHKINTSLTNVVSEQYNWIVNGTSVKYDPFWKVIPRNWVNPNEEGYGCMWFPYRHELACPSGATARLRIGEEYEYFFGPQQDDMLLIIELEFAVKNMADKVDGFNITFNEPTTSGTKSIARINVVNNEIKRRTNSTKFNQGTIQKIEDERFYQIRLVVDKKTGTFDYYLDGVLLEKDVAPFHAAVTGFGTIGFQVPHQAEYCNAEMFFDNIKVYELQKSVVEETFDQNPVPTHSPEPTASPNPAWVEFPVNETYDDYEVGTLATATAENKGYIWDIVGDVYPDLVKVVAKSTVDENASSTDNCLEIPYDYAAGAGTYRLTLDQNLMYTLGAEVSDNKSIVFEMDVAIDGEGTKENGYRIYFSERRGGGSASVARIAIKEDSVARMINSSVVNKKKMYPMSKGEFVHMKVVINKQTKQFTYYVNGTPVEIDIAPFSSGVPNFGTIYFTSLAETTNVDSSLYVDNMKVYVEETQPSPTEEPLPTLKPTAAPTTAPTAVPTAVPGATPTVAPTAAPEETADPYHVNLNFDDVALGTKISSFTAGDVYFWNTAGRVGNGKVVAKTDAVADASASDKCLILTSGTLPGYYVLRLSKPIYLGQETFKDSNLIVELDVAIVGTDTSKSPMAWFYFGQNATNDYENQLTTFCLENHDGTDRWVRIDDQNTDDATATTNRYVGPTVERGKFATLKLVVNRGNESNSCSYYWDGQLVKTSTYNGAPFNESSFNKDSNWGGIEFSELKIGIPTQLSTSDPKIYIDNLKIYTEAVSTAMPTTEPTVAPSAEPTAAPTVEPTAEPTVAPSAEPTAEPTAEPVLPPDETPTAEPTIPSGPSIVSENYDSKGGKTLVETATDGYTWTLSSETEEALVISKADAIGGDASDYCVKLPSSNSYVLRLAEAVALENSEYSESNLVVELDVAFVGTTMVGTSAIFELADQDGSSQFLKFNAENKAVSGTYADRWMRVHSTSLSYVGPTIDKGIFGTLKMVVNRGGSSADTSCSYYWNGQLVEETIYFNKTSQKSKAAASSFKKYNNVSAVEFDRFTIQVPQLDDGEDVAVYIDNLKIYTE
ncbi:MAG: S-layer homology domain-containing protein [Lachnospiraceae bacterium]|nr:S-layer homology domain-containing protein [Lachnospiraceae bacterium]